MKPRWKEAHLAALTQMLEKGAKPDVRDTEDDPSWMLLRGLATSTSPAHYSTWVRIWKFAPRPTRLLCT